MAIDPQKGPGREFFLLIVVAGIIVNFINLLEQPFARSLVVCDTPIDTRPGAPKPLSRHCGDRLFVIGEGARLSVQAHTLEQTCKIFSSLIIGSLADIFGRKPMFVWCLGLPLISVCLYVWASFDALSAPWLFVIAQGLQGAGGGTVVGQMLWADIAIILGPTKAAEVFAKRDGIYALLGFCSFLVSQAIAGLELLDYGSMWIGVLFMIITVFIPASIWFPETMVKKSNRSEANLGFLQRFAAELSMYKGVFIENRLAKWSLLSSFLDGPQAARDGVASACMMAFFGYSQRMLVIRSIPYILITGRCAHIVNNYCKKVGYTRGFWRTVIAIKIGLLILIPLNWTVWWMPWSIHLYFKIIGGFGGLWSTVRHRTIGAESTAKYTALEFFVGCMTGSVSNYVVQLLFNEKAATFGERFMAVSFFPTLSNFFNCGVMMFLVYPRCRETLAAMDAELEAEKQLKEGKPVGEDFDEMKKKESYVASSTVQTSHCMGCAQHIAAICERKDRSSKRVKKE